MVSNADITFQTISNVIDGVVITFLNINNLKTAYEEINKLNQEIQLAREYADNIIDTVGDSLLILDKDLKVLSANRSFYKTFNTISENIEGKFIYELDNKKWDKPQLRELLEQIIPSEIILKIMRLNTILQMKAVINKINTFRCYHIYKM